MPTYTFLTSYCDRAPDATDSRIETLRDHDDAISFAKAMLDVETRVAETVSIAVGCGAGDDIEWLGAWDKEPGLPSVWSKDD